MTATVTVTVPGIVIDASPPNTAADISPPVAKEYIDAPAWMGDYTFTAGDTEQTIAVTGYRMTQDIKIAPVPQSYGRIDWDGSTLTVY